jgi:hypothetical protein
VSFPWELGNVDRQLALRLAAYAEALARSTTGRGPRIRARRRELRDLARRGGRELALELALSAIDRDDDRRRRLTAEPAR